MDVRILKVLNFGSESIKLGSDATLKMFNLQSEEVTHSDIYLILLQFMHECIINKYMLALLIICLLYTPG